MPHIHQYIDFVSVAYIVHKNKVLLADHIKYNTWLPVGGHIELREDPEQALLREVEEECGLDITLLGKRLPEIPGDTTKPLCTPQHINIHDITEKHKHVVFVYYAASNSDQFTVAEKEHRKLKWFTETELKDQKYNIKPFIKIYAKEALKLA
ncbi:MAG: NUDIX domain-containing protein [bacterium]|nr:NUDIX domain-containing protein [bacterium]